MEEIAYIKEYIKSKKHNEPEFCVSCNTTLDGKIKYWASFSMTDDENEDYIDLVQVEGDSQMEVVHKIVEYLKSGSHYDDGRYL
jgi:hypothetical protein|nr:MAG TPA: hypothetical protein [Caudoviricetes sp.]